MLRYRISLGKAKSCKGICTRSAPDLDQQKFSPTWRNFKDYLELRDHVKDYCDDSDVDQPCFGSERMGYNGLRAVLTRRAQEAGVEEPALHDFRRAFALAMLQNG